MVEVGQAMPPDDSDVTAMDVSMLDVNLQDAVVEARRLMLSEDFDAASAAYRVGYNDASHFNREYKSLFGAPPMRDVQRLRDAAMEGAGPLTRENRSRVA